jgi:hypothetical protein
MFDIRSVARVMRLSVLGPFVVTVYATATLLSPLSHHDLACHLKSSTHCTTCVVGSSGEADAPGAVQAHATMPDAGCAQTSPIAWAESRPLGSVPPRAPPAPASFVF